MENNKIQQKTLLHIGFHKTGSSFLQAYFNSHPKVCFTRNIDIQESENNKTVHLVISNMQITVSMKMNTSIDELNESFDIETFHRNNARNLYLLYPEGKVLIGVRNFEDMLPSLYSQYLINCGRLTFDKFIGINKNQLVKIFNYDKVVEIYSQFFSIDQIVVLPYEMLKSNPEDFLRIVESELSLARFDFSSEIVNKSLTAFSQSKLRKRNVLLYYLTYLLSEKTRKLVYVKCTQRNLINKEKWSTKSKNQSSINLKNEIPKDLIELQKLSSVEIKKLKHVVPYAKYY